MSAPNDSPSDRGNRIELVLGFAGLALAFIAWALAIATLVVASMVLTAVSFGVLLARSI